MNRTNTTSDQQDEDTPPLSNMTDVHVAWLSAGANDDVASMRQLKSQFPEWLGLQRVVGDETSSLASRHRSYSWTEFHLDTIGASALHTSAWNGELNTM
ncbi:unnamed protein product [Peronospora belbahrii]|uniref:Uncharacterized protein n=1 Tax=Peronospora belbahrii TaxID=622444 RepID=A0AAU9L9E9_9STRA|nr:unnamed protein product [Peronospora belbahrii]CAH0515134.1 unnamed protein product [Peronospora belbahrii]